MLSENQLNAIDFILFAVAVITFVRVQYLTVRLFVALRRGRETKDGRPLGFFEIDKNQPTKMLEDFLFPPPEHANLQAKWSRAWLYVTLAFGALFLWGGLLRDLAASAPGG